MIKTVYPCVYREHMIFTELFSHCAGLSLCIQGTWREYASYFFYFRFIPVYTGNIPNPTHSALLEPVYPCVYREHSDPEIGEYKYIGLSLCIQGTYQL